MSRVFTKPYEACIQGCLDCNVQSSHVSVVVFWFTISLLVYSDLQGRCVTAVTAHAAGYTV